MADAPHCHHTPKPVHEHSHESESCCEPSVSRPDYLLWGSLFFVTIFYLQQLLLPESAGFAGWYATLVSGVYEFLNRMWWSLVLGILMLALLVRIPREFVMSALGRSGGVNGLFRATAAGVLLDLCSHGILMVAAQLYRKGASTGQVMAFLIASPWNSLSLTLILFALIGFWWTLALIALSMVIAVITGYIFDLLVRRRILPDNPNSFELPKDFQFVREATAALKTVRITPATAGAMLVEGLKESRMVMRWILFGVLLAAVLRALMPEDFFSTWFGPSLAGLALTIVAATIVEVCSEGSVPIAADLFTRAGAPGNSFAFLMAGVSTDYTEIMILRETTRSWKIALFLPLVTVPQILFIAILLNHAVTG